MAEEAPERSKSSGAIRGRRVLGGMALLSCSLLVLEIATTRLLSVAMAYHFAVLSISLAMLGLAVGGVAVHAWGGLLARVGHVEAAGVAALAFAIATLAALLALLGLPINPVPSVAGVMNLALLFVPQAVPYALAGTAIAILLAAFPADASRLYAADLVGAAAGCLLAAFALPLLGGPGTILLGSCLAATSAALLLHGEGRVPALRSAALRPLPWLAALCVTLAVATLTDALQLVYVKGYPQRHEERQRWTAHSRLSFSREICGAYPFGWGFGWRLAATHAPYCRRRIQIDGMAETPIVRWTGGGDDVTHVLWDVTSMPYLMKEGGRAMIIGSGGGRDIVASQLAGSWRVDAVEINEGIVDAMTHEYADFSGRVYLRPGVTVTNVDGRSALERAAPASYDLVQMSAVDTWATGSSGALALMENGLYTVEAFAAALRALGPGGYLSVSRFKYPEDHYGETIRMVAIALEAVASTSHGDAGNVLLVTNGVGEAYNIATMLVKPTPFTAEETARARDIAEERGFDVAWPAGASPSPVVELLAAGGREARDALHRSYPIDVRPTWDDRPYFFHQARLASIGNLRSVTNPGAELRLVPMLTILQLAVFLLGACGLLVAAPALLAVERRPGPANRAMLLYFTALGLGFMLYEIPLVQKLTLGLGHPTRALTVVLFGLLAGTGIGSHLSARVPEDRLRTWHMALGGASILVGAVLAFAGEPFVRQLFVLGDVARVAAAALAVVAVGLVLGTMFPLGIRLLCRREEQWMVPWCWAANGAMGVMASVLGLLIGIEIGMRAAFGAGSAAYLVALLAARAQHARHQVVGGSRGREGSRPQAKRIR